MRRRLESLVSRNYTCAADDLVCCFGSNVIKELLSALGESCILFGYKNEGTLYHITAVLDGFFTRCNAVNCQCFYGIFYRSKRSIADCTGVACNGSDNVAGRGQFLTVLALIFGIGDGLKAISCTAACFTTDEYDLSIVATNFFPILDFTGVDLCNGFYVKIKTGLLGFTMIAMPSYARIVPSSPFAFSSSLRLRLARPMSHLPS